MSKMKLISTTDFVLELGKTNDNELSSDAYVDVTLNYANFLKQHLTLGMFVPCDEDGNVLEEPKIRFDGSYDIDEVELYQQAKERVLFEDFIYIKEWYRIEHKPNTSERNCRQLSYIESLNIVEDVLEFNDVILTPSALKQIGL